MSQMIRTNYRSGIVRSDTISSTDAVGLVTISFPAFGGNIDTMLYATNASTGGTVEGSLPIVVTPTASFSGNVTWLKVWSSTTSAAGTFRLLAAAITGSI